MTDELMEPDPDPPRFDDYRDVGIYLSGPGRWEWATSTCENLLDYLEREGEATTDQMIQATPLPGFANKLAFSDHHRIPIFMLEIGPILSTHDAVEWVAWSVAEDAPPFPDAAADVTIPRGTRSTRVGTFSTERFAGAVEQYYAYLKERDRKVSTYELVHRHPFQLEQHLDECLGYLAALDGVNPPENREEFGLSPLAEDPRRYARALDGSITPDESDWLQEQTHKGPVSWRYVGGENAAEAEANAEGTA